MLALGARLVEALLLRALLSGLLIVVVHGIVVRCSVAAVSVSGAGVVVFLCHVCVLLLLLHPFLLLVLLPLLLLLLLLLDRAAVITCHGCGCFLPLLLFQSYLQ